MSLEPGLAEALRDAAGTWPTIPSGRRLVVHPLGAERPMTAPALRPGEPNLPSVWAISP